MKLYVQLLVLALNTLISAALKLSFKQARRSLPHAGTTFSVSRPAGHSVPNILDAPSGGDLDLNSIHDLIYLSNVTIGGNQYVVQLDTGSSDLWVKGASSPLPDANETSTTYNLTYGIGWAFGHISYASVQFAGISVPNQAFLDVSNAQNPALGYGANGILGLGFTSLSTIDALINKTSASTGRSLLFNLFQDNPNEPNFIAFSLQRGSDSTDDIQGTFSVGEYEPKYAGVANTTSIPTWPVNSPSRWNVLLDSFIVHGETVAVTSVVQGAPANKAVALLDSGSSYSYVPKYVCDAIYSEIAGASFDPDLGQWIVPCDVEVDMAIQIAGQIFPLHPLDITPNGVTDPSTCVGSFLPQSLAIGTGQFDWLIGDNFLRNVYSIYDFGDFDSSHQMGNPYIKLLPLVDPNAASVSFHQIRGGTPNSNITYNASGGSSDSSSAVITLSDKVAKSLNLVGMLFPAMLAVMALNGLVLLTAIIVGLVYCCRRKKSPTIARLKNSLRRPRHSRMSGSFHRMSAMPMNPSISVTGEPEPNHSYEPVSMAMTEDTVFSTPTPAFRKWEGDAMRPGVDRPRTAIFASTPPIGLALSSPTNHRASVARTEGITAGMDYKPPSPGFFQVQHDRPKSRNTTPEVPVSPSALPTSSPTNAHAGGPSEAMDYTPPSPGFFQVEPDGQGSRRNTLVTPPPPIVPPTSSPTIHRASVARSLVETVDYAPPSPGFFQVDHDGQSSRRTTLATPPSPNVLPTSSPTIHRASIAHTGGLAETMDYAPPSPGFFQAEPRSRRTTLVTPPPPNILPSSPTSRSHHSAASVHSQLSTPQTEDITEGEEMTLAAQGFLQPGQDPPRFPSTNRMNLPPSRLPPPIPTSHRTSVARTEGINDMEFRRPMPGFMQGDRPRSMA